MTGDLMPLAEHHPDGLECIFLHEREGGGNCECSSLWPEVDGSARVRMLWMGSCQY
jgi:hypothetical protein